MIEAQEVFRMLAALGAVIGVILIAAWFGRSFLGRMQAGMKNNRLEVVSMRNLDQRHRVAVVRLDEKEHLLLLSPNSGCVVSSQAALPKVESTDVSASTR